MTVYRSHMFLAILTLSDGTLIRQTAFGASADEAALIAWTEFCRTWTSGPTVSCARAVRSLLPVRAHFVP